MVLLYIDPGAGSLLIQGLIATALAIPFFFRSTISRVLGRLRGTVRTDTPQAPEEVSRGT